MMDKVSYIRQFRPSVLLVEDDELTQKIEAYTFQELGCEVSTAKDAQTALKALDKPFDIIVLDVGLPDQSGVRLAEAIRHGRTKQNHNTPIVVVSAYATEIDRQRYLGAGVDNVLAKPMDHEKIKDMLMQIVDKNPPRH